MLFLGDGYMEKVKKAVSIVTIIAFIATAIYLICWILNIFDEFNLALFLTFTCLALGGFFAINSVNIMSKNRILGIVSLILVLTAVVLVIIMAWANVTTLLNVTIVFALLSITFNIIVSTYLDLGRTHFVPQIILYVLSVILDLLFILLIFGVIGGTFLTISIILLIIDFVGFIILKVLNKKQVNQTTDPNMITISKLEYDMLKEKAEKYDELMKNKN